MASSYPSFPVKVRLAWSYKMRTAGWSISRINAALSFADTAIVLNDFQQLTQHPSGQPDYPDTAVILSVSLFVLPTFVYPLPKDSRHKYECNAYSDTGNNQSLYEYFRISTCRTSLSSELK